MNDERRLGTDRRSGQDRRTEVDIRSADERQLAGERRSGMDRRSRLERRQTGVSAVEYLACQVQNAVGVDQKLDFLAKAMLELASGLAEIERRVRVIQQNTAYQRM